MKISASHWAKGVALLTLFGVLSSCGLPRVGPNKREIFSGSVQKQGDAFVVSVNDRVTRATAVVPALGFGAAFQNAGTLGSDTIRPGDTLGLTIYENVDDGLLAGTGTNSTSLEEVQVDGAGSIFVPYAGRIRAAGNTPEAIRRIITDKLDDQTPDPQVLVRRLAGDGATVSLTGSITGQGIYAIERPTRTLTAMLARAGGVSVEPEIARIKVIRGQHTGEVWFQDLFKNPRNDILCAEEIASLSKLTHARSRPSAPRVHKAASVRQPNPFSSRSNCASGWSQHQHRGSNWRICFPERARRDRASGSRSHRPYRRTAHGLRA